MATDRHVLIIGMGLIGGSIALAIKKKHETTVVGYDIKESHRRLAKSLDIVDETIETINDGVEDASLIVIATPVVQTEKIIEELAQLSLPEGTIITDVGSTKRSIVKKAAALKDKRVTFIGGHPMAGSHKSGITASRAHLFENAFYVLTPESAVPREKIDQLKHWLAGTNATFFEMTPEKHDKMVGVISHFPHVVAASLVRQLANLEDQEAGISRFAAGGFRDITRIASSNPVMWRDILLKNKDVLLSLLEAWEHEMNEVKQMIHTSNGEQIYEYFSQAKTYRDRLPERSKGALPSFYDLYVDVEDYPGVIAHVTGILGHRDISITNIEIIETREDILGVLRLSFRSERERQHAKKLLGDYHYETYILE